MKKVRVAVVERGTLADVLRGAIQPLDVAAEVVNGRILGKLTDSDVGVGYIEGRTERLPHFLVVPAGRRRELFAWVNTYCPFVTPLSQWCRVVSEDQLRRLVALEVVPEYGMASAAWAGAIIGEALLHIGSVDKLCHVSVTALQSCSSFVAARAYGLWRSGNENGASVRKLESARESLGVSTGESTFSAFLPVWTTLEELSGETVRRKGRQRAQSNLIGQCCKSIMDNGFVHGYLIGNVVSELGWPATYRTYERLGAEGRLEIFDHAVVNLERIDSGALETNSALAEFVVAYFAARIGGDVTGHMRLIERWLGHHPRLALWYGVVSALYRPEVWGTEFFGLGRLAVREISFPLRFDDPPRCDVSCEELMCLVEPNVRNSSLGFRGASVSALNVEVEVGVNGMIRVAVSGEPVRSSEVDRSREMLMEMDNLIRHLRATSEAAARLREVVGEQTYGEPLKWRGQDRKSRTQSQKKRRGRKAGSGRQLRLDTTC